MASQRRRSKLLLIGLLFAFLYLVLCSVFYFYSLVPQVVDKGKANTIDSFTSTGEETTTTTVLQQQQPKGVFIVKAKRGHQACRTLCTLTRFFNAGPKYPVRIFADFQSTPQQLNELQIYAGGADVKVILDKQQRWRQLPSMLNETQRMDILNHCRDFSKPQIAKCTELKVGLGYTYMQYWRYMHMADEPSLQEYDYFFSLDIDTFLTKPMPDPYRIMADNNLTGIYDVELFQSGPIAKGIQYAAEQITSLEERRHRFLNSPKFEFFDENGLWGGGGSRPPSIYGFAFGGRLDFFRTPRFKAYAHIMAYYTYRFRTDEQAVIGTAWALLAENDKVWYLPKRGFEMGLYHQGWVDNRQVMRVLPEERNETNQQQFYFHELDVWKTFEQKSSGQMGGWEYIRALGYSPGDDWEKCEGASGK